ncbi:hypothetical protein C5C28_09965 [Rathayibacter rathayi]|nr:hypothetical protein C5C28_09965 [Rathayibacter rathayi]
MGLEGWECSNDRACGRRARRQKDEGTKRGTARRARQLWSEADETDKSARDLAAEGARLRARAVTALTAFGISKSDAAVLLHVSPQRVSQLVKVSA